MTSAGNSPMTAFTLFCTFIPASFGSVPVSKRICTTPTPSFPASLLMYFMPGTPLIALSNGTIADFVTVSALAPVYSTVTFTSGGATLGNSDIGNCMSDKTPKNKMMREITIARIGLLMILPVMTFHLCCLSHS